jgi:hypothetical protein
VSQAQPSGPPRQDAPYYQSTSSKPDKLSGFLGKIQGTVAGFGSQLAEKIGTTLDPESYAQYGSSTKPSAENRFGSFAPQRGQNDVKWHVDGCSYMYAVSRALENAKEYIWILDCEYCPDAFPDKHGFSDCRKLKGGSPQSSILGGRLQKMNSTALIGCFSQLPIGVFRSTSLSTKKWRRLYLVSPLAEIPLVQLNGLCWVYLH